MSLRKSTVFLSLLALGLASVAAIMAQSALSGRGAAPDIIEKRGMVKRLALTDLVLFTDARYTRHPAMSDLHAPFQDHPLSLEHFPSGSLMAPPPNVRAYGKH